MVALVEDDGMRQTDASSSRVESLTSQLVAMVKRTVHILQKDLSDVSWLMQIINEILSHRAITHPSHPAFPRVLPADRAR